MKLGTLSKIDQEKGFGFISQPEGPDVFFHHSIVKDFETLRTGAEMKFELDSSAKRPRASSVLLVRNGDGKAEPAQRFDRRNERPRTHSRNDQRPRSNRRDENGQRRMARGSGGINRPRRDRRDDDREIRVPPNCQFGHVTRLFRANRAGKISAVTGGPELSFEQRAVKGIPFGRLQIGQYVQFAVSDRTEEPIAFFVQVAEKPAPTTPGQLSRHPRARRKKPTWRGKKKTED